MDQVKNLKAHIKISYFWVFKLKHHYMYNSSIHLGYIIYSSIHPSHPVHNRLVERPYARENAAENNIRSLSCLEN